MMEVASAWEEENRRAYHSGEREMGARSLLIIGQLAHGKQIEPNTFSSITSRLQGTLFARLECS